LPCVRRAPAEERPRWRGGGHGRGKSPDGGLRAEPEGTWAGSAHYRGVPRRRGNGARGGRGRGWEKNCFWRENLLRHVGNRLLVGNLKRLYLSARQKGSRRGPPARRQRGGMGAPGGDMYSPPEPKLVSKTWFSTEAGAPRRENRGARRWESWPPAGEYR